MLQCSVSCDKGMKQRYVTCINSRGEVVDAEDCDQVTKPEETATCLSTRACGNRSKVDVLIRQ